MPGPQRNMVAQKTNKELAYLQELFVATDWGERFAELTDEHVKVPQSGRALYVAAGAGGHAIALQERAGRGLQLFCVDENEENLELAQAKARALKLTTEFQRGQPDQLPFADAQFELVLADCSLVHPERLTRIIPELVRSAAAGATVALTLPSFSSFGEFFSLYWEALHNCGLLDHEADVEALITTLPAVSFIEEAAAEAGLREVISWTALEEFDYESPEKFLRAPLIAHFLMPIWLQTLPAAAHDRVLREISRLINEESRGATFSLTVKATLVLGRKELSQ